MSALISPSLASAAAETTQVDSIAFRATDLWHIASHTVPIAPSRLSRITSILLNTALLGCVRGKSSRAAAICKVSKQYCGSIKPAFKRDSTRYSFQCK